MSLIKHICYALAVLYAMCIRILGYQFRVTENAEYLIGYWRYALRENISL